MARVIEMNSRQLEGEDDPDMRRRVVIREELSEALEGMEGGRPVVATLANAAFQDMLLNWWRNVRAAGMQRNALVGALDEEMREVRGGGV